MSLVTTCPSCGTVFRMVREQLDASGGWVRCGHCMDVFDAKVQLSESMIPEVELPSSDAASPTLSFVQSAQKKAFWQVPSVRWLLLAGLLLLFVVLFLQVLRFERDRIVTKLPSLSTTVQKLCAVWTCPMQARRQIEAWLIEHSSFQKENTANSASTFRLAVQLKNPSSQRLLLPHLELTLLDANEALLVRTNISLPAESSSSANAGSGTLVAASMGAGEERGFSYLIDAPTLASRIVGYRVVLFYP